MYLLSKLYQTYQNNLKEIGKFEVREFEYGEKKVQRPITPLLPLYHTTQHSQLTLTLDGKGNLLKAETNAPDETITIIPATEKSSGRTSGLSPHALCDKLQYVAGDYTDFVSDKDSGYKLFLEQLTAWTDFDKENKTLQSILAYVKKGTLIQDIVTRFPGLLPCSDDGKILLEWKDKTQDAPPIFKLASPATPADALVRWKVEIPRGDAITAVWKQPALYESWKNYQLSLESQKGLCYVTGEEMSLATQHPAKIRNGGDGAKIVSSNDKSGFTFRGRFCDASEVCGIGTEVTQKAHNALRWLISKQGWSDSTLSIVAWSPGYLDIPSPMEDSSEPPEKKEGTEEVLGRSLHAASRGAQADLSNANEKEHVLILALDSASPGRMAVSYFQEFPANKYVENIAYWRKHCYWRQQYSRTKIFEGTPAPKYIVEAVYGNNVSEKLRRQTIRRILPCITEQQSIPEDLVANCIRRASNKIAMEWWEWEKILGIACALYRLYSYQQSNKTEYTMELDENNQDRSYLYGRLLAVAEHIENYALFLKNPNKDKNKDKDNDRVKRSTNAERLMQSFAVRPYSTWPTIELSLSPYYQIITKNDPDTAFFFKKQLTKIVRTFETQVEFENDTKLTGAFLIGYHLQRSALWEKKKDNKPVADSNAEDSSN